MFPQALLFLLSCSNKKNGEEETCDLESHSLPVDEIFEGWTVSMQDIVDEINQYNTCVWENDGAITRFDIQLMTREEHQFPIPSDIQYGIRSNCSYSSLFYLYTTYYSEDGELLLEGISDGHFGTAMVIDFIGYYWRGTIHYGDASVELPPSSPPKEEEYYTMNLLARGDIPQGAIEQIAILVTDGDQVDAAYCYKE